MAEQKSSKGDDGRGQPFTAEHKTVEEPKRDNRLIPGGSLKAARTPIGMSAVDRADMPSGGKSTGQASYKDTPSNDAERPLSPPEPGSK